MFKIKCKLWNSERQRERILPRDFGAQEKMQKYFVSFFLIYLRLIAEQASNLETPTSSEKPPQPKLLSPAKGPGKRQPSKT